jgi:hypothetical protein
MYSYLYVWGSNIHPKLVHALQGQQASTLRRRVQGVPRTGDSADVEGWGPQHARHSN